jgi:hypothetical protein
MHAQSAAAILSTRIRRACLPEVKDGAPPVGNGSISRKEARTSHLDCPTILWGAVE